MAKMNKKDFAKLAQVMQAGLSKLMTDLLVDSFQAGYEAGADAAMNPEPEQAAESEKQAPTDPPQAENEQVPNSDHGPENFRHALAEPGITECGRTGPVILTLEMTTGERITCPKCLASIEAKKAVAAV